MINLFLLMILLACLGITAAWVAGNPGSVTIHWFDYRIDTSFAFLLLLAIVTAVVLAYAWLIVRRIIRAPRYFSEKRALNRYKKALAALTQGVAALAATDLVAAETHTRKVEKLLGKTPLTLLLSAQVARSKGDDVQTRVLLEQMLDHKETEYLAARSLSEVAGKQQLFPKALALAERAHAINPKGIDALVSLHVRLGRWQEALAASTRAARKRQIGRAEAKRYHGIAHLEQGRQLLEQGRTDMALVVARQCAKELPGFVPGVLLMAKALEASDRPDKAVKVIFQAWKAAPHPQLMEELRPIIADEPAEKQRKLLRKLEALNPKIPESGAWKCSHCGHAEPDWKAHCPECSSFDTLKWL